MSQNQNSGYVWIIFTNDNEKFKIFLSQESAIAFGKTIIGNFPEPNSSHWHKAVMPIGLIVSDYSEHNKIEKHVWMISRSAPIGPVAVFVSEKNAKKHLDELIGNGESVTCTKFSVLQ
jgi:hypothetical protein